MAYWSTPIFLSGKKPTGCAVDLCKAFRCVWVRSHLARAANALEHAKENDDPGSQQAQS